MKEYYVNLCEAWRMLPEYSQASLPLITVHRIDALDQIVYMDDGFRDAATVAGLADLPERVLGTSLFNYMSGDATKQWYRHLIDHVRRHGSAHFEFHCDTPTLIRLPQMEMRLLSDRSIEFTAMTLSTTPRASVPFVNWALPRSVKTVRMCSICMRVSSVIGWTDVERAAQVLQAFEEPLPPAICYAICEDDEALFNSLPTNPPGE